VSADGTVTGDEIVDAKQSKFGLERLRRSASQKPQYWYFSMCVEAE
jgi:hypothetical protein